MSKIRRWVSDWWGQEEREVILNESLGLPARRPHWSANLVRITAAFYRQHWQWLWGTAIAVLSLWVAVLSMKN